MREIRGHIRVGGLSNERGFMDTGIENRNERGPIIARDFANSIDDALLTCKNGGRLTHDPRLVCQISRVMDIREERRQCYRGREDQIWVARESFMERALALSNGGQDPLLFAFPGFPCKSPNDQDKVLGSHPDMAERMSIKNLGEMLKEIEAVYPAGASIMIVSDGLPFNSLFGIDDKVVFDYTSELRALSYGSSIEFLSMLDIIQEGQTVAQKRDILLARYGPNREQLMSRIKNDPETNAYYTGLKLFLEGDMAPLWAVQYGNGEPITRSLRNKLSADLAKEFMVINEAFNRAVEEILPRCLRLSCHPQYENNTNKVGIELIFGRQKHSWATPWHNAMLKRGDGSWDLTRKGVALREGCVIIDDEAGRPCYLAEVPELSTAV